MVSPKSKTGAEKPQPSDRPLDARERVFVDEYLVDLNAERAALVAGYAPSMASTKAYRWVSSSQLKPHVYRAVQDRMAEREKRTAITQDDVLRRLFDIATANPNEIVSVRIECCRHCWGVDHQYQWVDEAEFDAVVSAVSADKKATPDMLPNDRGGYGFDPRREPHADCPKCLGEGSPHVALQDTRRLKGPARALYAGAKQGKYGIEAQMHDQMKAMELLGRHLGLFNDKLKLQGDEENPLTLLIKRVQGSAIKPVREDGR